MFKSVRKNLRPLFGNDEPIRTGRLDALAGCVPAGLGLRMMAAQASNEVLRHCRIGQMTFKSNAR